MSHKSAKRKESVQKGLIFHPFPQSDCSSFSCRGLLHSRAYPGEQVTWVLLFCLNIKPRENYFPPLPRLYKQLVFRLRHVKRPERLGLLDTALVMVTQDGSKWWRRCNMKRVSQQPLRGWSSASSHIFTVTAPSHSAVGRGLPTAFPPHSPSPSGKRSSLSHANSTTSEHGPS